MEDMPQGLAQMQQASGAMDGPLHEHGGRMAGQLRRCHTMQPKDTSMPGKSIQTATCHSMPCA